MSAPLILAGVVSAASVAALLSSAYVVDEGRIGVLTNMGKAVEQVRPEGLQFKTPFIEGVKEFDVRERSITLELNGSTSNQLNTSVSISVNWRPDPEQVMDIFIKYGSPDEFAVNILRPRLAQSAKSTIGKFSSVQLTRERNAVAEAILTDAQRILEQYPAILSSVQLDNFTLPERYWNAVLDREEQREKTEKEKLYLEQQKLTATQLTQTAQAEANAVKAAADGEAYRVGVTSKADADAIRLKGQAQADTKLAAYQARAEGLQLQMDALGDADAVVAFNKNIAWDGTMPTTVMGGQPELLMQMPTAAQ